MARSGAYEHADERDIDRGILPSLLGFHLRVTQLAVFRDFAGGLGRLGITPGLFAALVLIERNPGLKQSALAKAVYLDRSTMVSLIDNMERRRLVERHAVPHDRRSNALRLTAEGVRLLGRARRAVAAHERRLARHLEAPERDQLLALLAKIFPEHRRR